MVQKLQKSLKLLYDLWHSQLSNIKMKLFVIYHIVLLHSTDWLNEGEINNSPQAGEHAWNPRTSMTAVFWQA